MAAAETRRASSMQPVSSRGGWLPAAAAIATLGGIVWGIAQVAFVNYDSLYALVWGAQLGRGQTPQYGIPVAPTPHPLIELLGLIGSALGPAGSETLMLVLAFAALGAVGYVTYRLGSLWIGRAAGVLAAALILTRVPILSYGVRAYVDVPYLLFVLGALLIEARRRNAGAPVLAMLALAGLLRPEAWAFSALYWLWMWRCGRPRAELVRLAALAASAPAIWMFSDLAVTGNPLWSLTNTRDTAAQLHRVRGVANVPEYIPRRIGEIDRVPVLAGAAVGAVLGLWWLRDRVRLGAWAGVVAVAVFALFAAAGLPIDTRYAFLASAILCVFCAAGALGWSALPAGDRRRRPWMIVGAILFAGLLAYAPAQYRSARRELGNLARQQRIQSDLVALVDDRQIDLRCGPIGVPNHRPVPVLALHLRTSPADVVSAQVRRITHGTYLDPANAAVRRNYILDPHDPTRFLARVPIGFALLAGNRSWKVFRSC